MFPVVAAFDPGMMHCKTFDMELRCWCPTFWRSMREEEMDDLMQLLLLVQSFQLVHAIQDRWKWNWDKEGQFSVRSIYSIMQRGALDSFSICIWQVKSPLKLQILLWWVSLNSLLLVTGWFTSLMAWTSHAMWRGRGGCVMGIHDQQTVIEHVYRH